VGDATEIADIAGIEAEWNLVQQRLERLRAQPGIDLDAWADAHLFVKGVRWAIDFEPSLDEQERQLLRAALRRANERAAALAEGNSPWTELKGQMVRGFVSAVDGSTQPYGLVVPAGYDPGKPTRLDVVLHGSRRATGLGELLFINGFDLGDREIAADATQEGNPPASAAKSNYIELHPMGRLGENAYRFEGETDVDEAIEAVCRHYAVDRRRIVLRGSSLGGVGAWQLGLKRPDRYVALGPTAGPVDTVQFARSPWPHFVPLDPFTPWQQTTLSLVDPVGYAANAGMVPVVAAMGDQDPYYPAQAQMERACEQAGVSITALVDRGAGHSITDNMKAEQMRLLDEHAARPLEPVRRRIRFVTWTLKFPRCHWIELLRLDAHYQRAEIDARIEAGGAIRIREAKNVSRFAIHAAELESQPLTVFVGETACAVPPMQAAPRATHRVIVFSRKSGVWGYEGELDQLPLAGKRPGLQGPIDDAFAAPFLCVRGTGEAWHPHVSRWAEASLRRWAYEWRRRDRGGSAPVPPDSFRRPREQLVVGTHGRAVADQVVSRSNSRRRRDVFFAGAWTSIDFPESAPGGFRPLRGREQRAHVSRSRAAAKLHGVSAPGGLGDCSSGREPQRLAGARGCGNGTRLRLLRRGLEAQVEALPSRFAKLQAIRFGRARAGPGDARTA
jgi:poly(3-hydroxybutyrate) depolymerase